MPVSIRKFTVSDYPAVRALWLRTPGMGLNDKDDAEAGISRFLARNPETCYVAEQDGVIIGVIMAGHDGRRGFIYHTAVDASHRRKGVGKTLADAALTALKREGINKAAMVVFGKNDIGNAFWERLGFTARTDIVYRNKALVEMERIDT
ncbi:MAG: GNAT family N-acetyltransferase [Oscillospiraceae bacterium]|nr:GNAT family N-acetyltransferase [Oscillospiraceae bacterium]